MSKRSKQFCINGHDTFICGRTKYYHCVECHRSSTKNYQVQYRKQNKDKINLDRKIYYKHNVEKIKLATREYRERHPEVYQLASLRSKGNRALRVPQFGQDGIKEFYRNCPKGNVVDHVIPLQNKLVSGLHVIWNLQYLTPRENNEKGSRINLIRVSNRDNNAKYR